MISDITQSLFIDIANYIINIIYVYDIDIHKWTDYISIYIRGAYDQFPDFFRMGTFIDTTHMKL